jgi:hypothetical protein
VAVPDGQQVLGFAGRTTSRISVERKRVSASTLRSVGYDAGKQLLEIEFSSGSIVQYSGVSPEVHRRFMSSPSPGSFFQDQIDENFPSRRVR